MKQFATVSVARGVNMAKCHSKGGGCGRGCTPFCTEHETPFLQSYWEAKQLAPRKNCKIIGVATVVNNTTHSRGIVYLI